MHHALSQRAPVAVHCATVRYSSMKAYHSIRNHLAPRSQDQDARQPSRPRRSSVPSIPETWRRVPQRWNKYDNERMEWKALHNIRIEITEDKAQPKLVLVTWNVDGFGERKEARMAGILEHIMSLTPVPDIVFLQEVSSAARDFLLTHPVICESWFSSEMDGTNWIDLPFATITLLSKSRFALATATTTTGIGNIWREKFPSRYGRDALCCDVFVPSSSTCIRLINVHLDSLAHIPSRRVRQISISATLLKEVGHGLIAGDFNPVLRDDKNLVPLNNLTDAWLKLHRGEPGYTWGINRNEAFPPNRLDKVALFGLVAHSIEIMNPGILEKGEAGEDALPWSDHSGLNCTFGLDVK
ncbi:Endonuclease/exonuclease/phosphatase [Limtongia smithiae]|uniref:Endonuclease/exonuclease/phosphatase n=1 Tax=Limtongia smithiae TaxID=1125753 RepID=UPI0034CE09EC